MLRLNTKRKTIFLLILLTFFVCRNNAESEVWKKDKFEITVINKTNDIICFDRPVSFYNDSYEYDKEIYYFNTPVDSIERVRQFDLKHGSRTYLNSYPEATLQKLSPNQSETFFVKSNAEKPDSIMKCLFCFFYMLDNKNETRQEIIQFDRYVNAMLEKGYLAYGTYNKETDKFTFFISKENSKKVNQKAVSDFPTFLED